MLCHRRILTAAILLLTSMTAPIALADPPSHAPAHGWRAKHDPQYVGYTGYRWYDDFGVRDGHCDRDQVGAAIGAVIGGAIGSTVGSGNDRLIAILAGATIGAIIGREIGRDMDRSDHACFGHSLELLEDGHRVEWNGARPGMRYTLTPEGRFTRDDRVCRKFTLVREYGDQRITRRGSACRYGEGEWRMVDG